MAAMKKIASPAMSAGTREFIKLQDAKIEIQRRGSSGKPLLLLHSEDNYETTQPFVDELAKKYRVFKNPKSPIANRKAPNSRRDFRSVGIWAGTSFQSILFLGINIAGQKEEEEHTSISHSSCLDHFSLFQAHYLDFSRI